MIYNVVMFFIVVAVSTGGTYLLERLFKKPKEDDKAIKRMFHRDLK